MQPVWVLSVDLQTKTATFQSGLGDAARSARGAFNDIKGGSGEMGRAVSGNMMEARHGVMLLSEEFGIHLPRALTSFIASIGPIGAVMEAAFPFLAIAVGATLLIEHLVKMHEAGEKLTEDQGKFGVAVNSAFNKLDEKIIQAKIRADELRGDHLGALKLQLELIDKQSMDELCQSFEQVAKTADAVMKGLTGKWYTFGKGSEGATADLERVRAKYTELMSTGKKEDADAASGLLHSTQKSTEKVLGLFKQLQSAGRSNPFGSFADPAKFHEAEDALNKLGIAHSETVQKQIEGEEQKLGVLNAQIGAEERHATLTGLDKSNDKKTESNRENAQASARAIEGQQRIALLLLAGQRSAAETKLTLANASAAERLAVDRDFEERSYQIEADGNAKKIAALNRTAEGYTSSLHKLQEDAAELTIAHSNRMQEITDKAALAQNAENIRSAQEGEREKIEATQRGSAARLAAIDGAIQEEQSKNMQDLSSYRELLNQRVELVREMAEEEAKLKAEAGQEAAQSEQKMGELALASETQHQKLLDSSHRISDQQRVAEETVAANAEYAVKVKAFQLKELALDKSGKDYANKLKALQNKEKQLTQQHENDLTAIKEKAEIERNQRILSAEDRFNDAIASGLTRVIMGHQSFAKMMSSLGDQVVSGMLQNVIKSILMDDMTKEKDAAHAARKAYNSGMDMGPAGVVIAPAWAAEAFAAVMAFEGGGIVPGVGRGDTVPAMLTPGEGVVPKGVMEGLSNMSKFGGMQGGGSSTVVHVRPVYHVQTIDGNGMKAALEKHTDVLQRHFESVLRKMNR